MAVLPNVPPIPDQDRYIFLNVTSATTVIPVTFPVFGAQEDLIVRVNYQPLPSSAWTFTSLSGTPLNQLPLPITDGIVTLLSPVASGLIEVIGNWQPRQVLQPTAPGIARREFNQTISTLIAGMREQSRILSSSIPFIQTDSLGDGYYSAGGDLISNIADPVSLQDAVNLETMNAALSSIIGSGGGANIQSWALTGTGAQLVFPIALAGVLPNNSLAFLVTANGLAVDPANYSIQVAAQTITFTQAPANGADIQVRMLAYSRAASGISTTVQAIAGTDDATYMSPLKVAQAVAQDLVNFLASSPLFSSNVKGPDAGARRQFDEPRDDLFRADRHRRGGRGRAGDGSGDGRSPNCDRRPSDERRAELSARDVRGSQHHVAEHRRGAGIAGRQLRNGRRRKRQRRYGWRGDR